MNIFKKDCPECAAANPIDAVSCRCGYCFDPETLAQSDPAEYAQQQDRLYRDYLAARMVQAEAQLVVARELAKADPENAYKASGVLLAEQALNALQAEMKQLSLRLPAPRRAVPLAARPSSAMAAPKAVVAQTPAKPTTVSEKLEAAPKTTAAAEEKRPPSPQPAALARQPVPAAAHAREPNGATKTAEGLARSMAQQVSARPHISAKPDENFKRVQAKRADAVARAKTRAAKVEAPTIAKRSATKPAAQPAPPQVPPLLIAAATPMQECPNCTATVPAQRKRCSCGYVFSRAAEEVPAITLDAAALAILTEGISANKNKAGRR